MRPFHVPQLVAGTAATPHTPHTLHSPRLFSGPRPPGTRCPDEGTLSGTVAPTSERLPLRLPRRRHCYRSLAGWPSCPHNDK